MRKVFLSTSIPYVNGKPHIGFAFEAVQSDIIARLLRRSGHSVYFTTGTDENALKNVESAEKAGQKVDGFVQKNASEFEKLCKSLNISNDTFIRTSSELHKKGAQKLWQLCKKDIYKKTYSGLYCIGCETFYEESEFADNICPNHNRKLELIEEENYFFALSRYQSQIEDLLTHDKLVVMPTYRKDELLNFVRKGLRDFSISRPTQRMKGWGIPVPEDDSQRMYVWYDALSNYISALGFGDDNQRYQEYWELADARIHIIGKDIIKFHGIYWPAMLLSAGLPVPTHLFTHGFITVSGQKMSKSLGNVVDPFELIKKYGVDVIRYYMAHEVPAHDDGDFSDTRLVQIFNADLANELGNLISRSLAIASSDNIQMPDDLPMNMADGDYQFAFGYQNMISTIWQELRSLNKSFNEFSPWAKDASSRKDFLITIINRLQAIAYDLENFLPDTAMKLSAITKGKIQKTNPLFPRL
jgi:methionyl-tRNA synthetase